MIVSRMYLPLSLRMVPIDQERESYSMPKPTYAVFVKSGTFARKKAYRKYYSSQKSSVDLRSQGRGLSVYEKLFKPDSDGYSRLDRGKILPTCCICGKEADHLQHGLWWCEDHRSYVRNKPKPSGESGRKFDREGRLSSVNLGLEWV